MLSMIELNELFYSYPILSQLSMPQQRALQQESIGFQAASGRRLFEVGDSCNWLILLIRGTLRVSRPTPAGRSITLYDVTPGESCLITVSSLLGGVPYMAQGTIIAAAKGVMISNYQFSQMLTDSESFRFYIFHLCSQRVHQLVRRFDSLDALPTDHSLSRLFFDPMRGNQDHLRS